MASVSKKIVLFSDGTGNSSASPQKTNVWRTYKALDVRSASSQVAFYDNGVGTSSFQPLALLGLAFGFGLARNVKQIYGFLCRNYKDGDEIYAFGFSRGAFTMRVVVGLIASQGIIDVSRANDDADLRRLIDEAYSKFRKQAFSASFLSYFWDRILKRLPSAKSGETPYDAKKNLNHSELSGKKRLITFVGLWDTVDAYGLPIDELTRAWDMVVWPLTATNRDLSDRVERACHALSLDEQRQSFEPMLWNEKPGGEWIDEKRLCQVWFAGVHANVGGSYPDDSLSLVPLNWMFGEAKKAGLKFLDGECKKYSAQQNINGPLYDNRSGVGSCYRYAPRKLEALFNDSKPNLITRLLSWIGVKEDDGDNLLWKVLRFFGVKGLQHNRVEIKKPKVHYTVFERMDDGCCSYAPINLTEQYDVVGKNGKIDPNYQPEVVATKPPNNLAPERRQRQKYVWNKVWLRKVLYFVTLAWLIAFVAYPYYVERASEFADQQSPDGGNGIFGALLSSWGGVVSFFEALLGSVSNVLRLIPIYIGKIPGLGFIENWAKNYSDLQVEFLLFVVGAATLLWISARVNSRLNSEMNSIWYSVLQKGEIPTTEISDWRKKLTALLNGKFYQAIEGFLKRGIEVLAVVIFFFLLVLSVVNHGIMVFADGTGMYCEMSQSSKIVKEKAEFMFDAASPCMNTGLKLVKNHQYTIKFQIVGGKSPAKDGEIPSHWHDASIKADVEGWRSAPWYMYLFTPYRRHWFANWYQPVARIDNKLFDIFPLKKDELAKRDPTMTSMTMDVKRGGDLYLYLNDAVIFSPNFFLEYYSNNWGYAKVSVTDVTPTR